ncbi:hypothetical protein DU977_16805 [Vibrio cholerae]|nr:hypothetical protein [Vibrio cholerae]
MCFVFYGVLLYFDVKYFLVVYLLHSTYHLVMQQIGMCKSSLSDISFIFMKLSALMIGFSLVLKVYVDFSIPYGDYYFLFLFFALFCILIKTSNEKFVTSNVVILLVMILLYFLDYVVLSLFFIRVIHDITAFYIYSVHESNRKSERVHMSLFLIYSFSTAVNIFLMVSLSSINIDLSEYTVNFFYLVSVFLAIGHYVLESSMWKSESPNRRYIF